MRKACVVEKPAFSAWPLSKQYLVSSVSSIYSLWEAFLALAGAVMLCFFKRIVISSICLLMQELSGWKPLPRYEQKVFPFPFFLLLFEPEGSFDYSFFTWYLSICFPLSFDTLSPLATKDRSLEYRIIPIWINLSFSEIRDWMKGLIVGIFQFRVVSLTIWKVDTKTK